jgi:hypothetical protein
VLGKIGRFFACLIKNRHFFMKNQGFFQIEVSEEQVATARQLVEYSIRHHAVPDIFAHDPEGSARQREFRMTGTLGEIVFADFYQLPRPTRSFGAQDGQDLGQDFNLHKAGNSCAVDLKTMRRQHDSLWGNYVLNIPAYQLHRRQALTHFYFCISLHSDAQQRTWASFLGFVAKSDLLDQRVGRLFVRGSTRTKANGQTFVFQRDTYEVCFSEIESPEVSEAHQVIWKKLIS